MSIIQTPRYNIRIKVDLNTIDWIDCLIGEHHKVGDNNKFLATVKSRET